MITITRSEFEILYDKLIKSFDPKKEPDVEEFWAHAKNKHYNQIAEAVNNIITTAGDKGMPKPAALAKYINQLNPKYQPQSEKKYTRTAVWSTQAEYAYSNRCIGITDNRVCGAELWKYPSPDAYLCMGCYRTRRLETDKLREYYRSSGMTAEVQDGAGFKTIGEVINRLRRRFDLPDVDLNQISKERNV